MLGISMEPTAYPQRSGDMEKRARNTDERTTAFLRELAELTHRHGVGIAGTPTLFLLERDDFALTYACNEESKLTLA